MSQSRSGAAFRDALIGASIAVTLILVVAFFVASKTVLQLVNIDTGFDPHEVVTATIQLPFSVVTPKEAAHIRSFLIAFDDQLAARTGRRAAFTTDVPGRAYRSIVSVQRVDEPTATRTQVGMSQVSGYFFSLVGVPLRAGRTFDASDNETSRRVVILDEDIARRLYGERDPIGQSIFIADLDVHADIVGLVGSVRQVGRLSERLPQIYVPFNQLPLATFAILVRSEPSADLRSELQEVATAVNPSVALSEVLPLEDIVYGDMRRPRFYALTLFAFALVSTVVSAAAVHASVAAVVAERTREIGIRRALGSTSSKVVRLVLGRVCQMAAVGSLAGALSAYAVLQVVEANIGPLGRPTVGSLLGSALILWSAALLAVLWPVLRATRVSPVVVLNE